MAVWFASALYMTSAPPRAGAVAVVRVELVSTEGGTVMGKSSKAGSAAFRAVAANGCVANVAASPTSTAEAEAWSCEGAPS